ncbi:MAG: 4-(cytidine 5'-diphospho)-2-C-methyl-D-erythritol kinase [Acidobacteria bacterium]|nr:4-(cytidine 5'-diphospho)-2-C-methyl-D-erythritol kinase [Acidobacteriota bacterium]
MNSEKFTLPSFAKINWRLKVAGRREDGFHELCTLFQTVSLADEIDFEPADETVLTCRDPAVPVDGRNLILRAAELLRNEFGVRAGARIHLEKRIPAPGGLGGGSSNAAVALLGLARLWKLGINFEKLVELGSRLGSDVPFFLYGGTAAGFGRGTKILPVRDVRHESMVIVTPAVEVSTAEAFIRLEAPYLTKEGAKSILKICQIEAESFDLHQSELKNDFEKSVFRCEPEIERVKQRLLEAGADQALLSGSGASVFAIFDKEETRQATLKALDNETNWRKFAVATISREEYRAALNQCSSLLPISF